MAKTNKTAAKQPAAGVIVVRFLTSIASPSWSYAAGDVAELPAELAQRWIDAGIAEPAEGGGN